MCIDFSCAIHIGTFLQCKTLHYKIRRALINISNAIPTHNFNDHYATLKKYKKHILCNTWQPVDVQVIDIIGLTKENNHMRVRQIDMVKLMWLVSRPWKKVNIAFGKSKHLLTLQMKSLFCEQKLKSLIGNGFHKIKNIPRNMGPPQKEFIPIRTLPKRTSLQVMLI